MKRLRLIALIVAVLLAGGFALHLFQSREPRYQGRSLVEWMDDYGRASASASDVEMDISRRAVKQIGSNAIPFLLKELSTKDTALEERLKLWLQRQPLVQFHFKYAWEHRLQGLEGFAILEQDASCAVPDLVELSRDNDADIRRTALNILCLLKPKQDILLPILLQAFHDPSAPIRDIAAVRLHQLYPDEAAKAGVYKKYPTLEHANPGSPLQYK
jgi:hypothetical protein